jgi:2-phospho-L-lactate guanylyltransferase (CobY/MobA/RfbA family)
VAALQAMQASVVSGTELVIAPDRHCDGTNALLVNADVREYTFGKGSYQRHLALGNVYGVRSFPCMNAALAFDLDTADDFAEWAKSGDVPHEFIATLPRAAPCGAGFVSSRTK